MTAVDQQRMEQEMESLFHERTTTQMKRAKTILFAVFAGLGVLYFLVGLVMLWMGVVSEEGFPMALVFIPLGLVFCGVGCLLYLFLPKTCDYRRYKRRVEKMGAVDHYEMVTRLRYQEAEITELKERVRALEEGCKKA